MYQESLETEPSQDRSLNELLPEESGVMSSRSDIGRPSSFVALSPRKIKEIPKIGFMGIGEPSKR